MSSDDSDFYGDDDVAAELKSRVKQFDVAGWWEENEGIETPLKLQARKAATPDTSRLHNPYAGVAYAWQLTETVDAFLQRLPPATTDETPSNQWIWICNPYIGRKAKSEADNQKIRGGEDEAPEEEGADLGTVVEGGMGRLHLAREFIDACKNSGQNPNFITRECRKAGADAARDILILAKAHRVSCGKWMIFSNVLDVNEVWEIVAKATANNELGIAAKVAPRSNVDRRTERLICVYTADFSDIKDVKRVAQRLKQLGLVQARGKPLYYKPDVYTYLGLSSGNPWEIRASIYDTNSMLGKG
ncbi:DUF1917-domain-containing protein [Xylariaceae sp. FL0662B]|nr:DUF1917-domain-containing protein [Xylariaceae sp. FL0662B]